VVCERGSGHWASGTRHQVPARRDLRHQALGGVGGAPREWCWVVEGLWFEDVAVGVGSSCGGAGGEDVAVGVAGVAGGEGIVHRGGHGVRGGRRGGCVLSLGS